MENTLDEKGFVFEGFDGKPYLMRIYDWQPWIFYWHPYEKTWVTLKPAVTIDVVVAKRRELPANEAKYYSDLHEQWLKRP